MKTFNASEFRVTMIDSTSLPERLATELRFLVQQLSQAWPDFKSDPIGFGKRAVAEARLRIRRALATPNSLAAISVAMLVVISAALIILLSGRASQENEDKRNDKEFAEISMLSFPKDTVPDGHGVGAGAQGRVGFAHGKGEGSAPIPRDSSGGGGGGNRDRLPAQQGKPPAPSEIPVPMPQFPPVQKQALPVAGIDIDPALWQNLAMAGDGDARSKSLAASNGPGTDGGMGTGNGTGVGEGRGPGVGPGLDGNIGDGRKGLGCCGSGGSDGNSPDDPERVYPPMHVTERARVIAKPEPQYTEDARKNQITGSVVLRVAFSRSGEVTNIRAINPLPFGLTERAIAAARLIRFRPATKDGRPVNVSMQLEYNFNLY